MSGQPSLWRRNAPDGYVSLSDSFNDTPYGGEIACVAREVVKPASIGGLIWNDSGSGAQRDGSVRAINNPLAPPDWSPFVATSGYGRPNRDVWVLDMDKVEVI